MKSITHHEKSLRRYPGVLIGRLAVASEFAKQGIGSEVLNMIKYMFVDPENKTGCRFIIVDAVNSQEVLSFYEKKWVQVFVYHRETRRALHFSTQKRSRESHEI